MCQDEGVWSRASFEQGGGGEGGRGFWTQNLVYQKWPDQIFPVVNFVFSRDGHFGLGRGGGGFGGGVPPPLWFLIILKKPWSGGLQIQNRISRGFFWLGSWSSIQIGIFGVHLN